MRSTIALQRSRAGFVVPAASTARHVAFALLTIGLWLFATEAQSQQRNQRLLLAQQEALRAKLNEDTVLVATSHPTGSYFAMAYAIATVLEKNGAVRVLPLPGDGGMDALRDLLFLRGMDLAIVPANVLAHAKNSEALGAGLTQRISYVARLHNEEVHVLAGRHTKALADLSGKKVGVPLRDGRAQFAAADLFGRFRINVEVVTMPSAEALELVRSGELAAVLLTGAKPLPQLADMPQDGSMKLLALPFTAAMEEAYVPAAFRAADYPSLIPEGQVVEGVAVSTVLVAHSAKGIGDTTPSMTKFVPAFFDAMSEQPLPGYNKLDVNLAATLPGWSRLPVAEDWLRKAQQRQALTLQKNFDEFLRQTHPAGSPSPTPAQRKKLFDDFVIWTRKSMGETEALARR